jgi:hypothetical protein
VRRDVAAGVLTAGEGDGTLAASVQESAAPVAIRHCRRRRNSRNRSGNEDCADGLTCTPKAQINTPYDSSDRCCPFDRTKATHPACVILTTPITTDAAPLDANTGPAIDATVDSADTSTPQEAGTDAADAAEGG